jgi:hypothetical protein
MFQTAQWANASQAAASLAQMALRGAMGDPNLSRVVRERQDLVAEWQKAQQLAHGGRIAVARQAGSTGRSRPMGRLDESEKPITQLGRLAFCHSIGGDAAVAEAALAAPNGDICAAPPVVHGLHPVLLHEVQPGKVVERGADARMVGPNTFSCITRLR